MSRVFTMQFVTVTNLTEQEMADSWEQFVNYVAMIGGSVNGGYLSLSEEQAEKMVTELSWEDQGEAVPDG